MHELALCRSISDIGLRACDGRPVVRVTVDVGYLRQVVPSALQQCWGFVTYGTLLEQSELVVNDIPAVVACQVCGHRTQLKQPFMVCESCGGTDVHVVSGREFLLRSIDVADEKHSEHKE